MQKSHVAFVAATLALCAGESFAQNQVTNANFDADLTGWVILDVATGTTAHTAAAGSPASPLGAAEAQLTDPGDDGTAQGLAQCVGAPPVTLPWDFGGRARVAAVSGSGTQTLVIVQMFNGAGCTG